MSGYSMFTDEQINESVTRLRGVEGNYVTDVLLCLELISTGYKITYVPSDWSSTHYYVNLNIDDYSEAVGRAFTLPRAICEAWLEREQAWIDNPNKRPKEKVKK